MCRNVDILQTLIWHVFFSIISQVNRLTGYDKSHFRTKVRSINLKNWLRLKNSVLCTFSSVVVCDYLSGKGPRKQGGVGRVVTSESMCGVIVSTRARNARDVGSIPALGAIFSIFITLRTVLKICHIYALLIWAFFLPTQNEVLLSHPYLSINLLLLNEIWLASLRNMNTNRK